MSLNLLELTKRIESAKAAGFWDKNCVSTALYLIGEEKKDEYIPPREIRLSALRQIEEPQLGALAVWSYRPWIIFQERVLHMGVVTGLNPTRITHRNGYQSLLVENESCEEISEGYPRPAKFCTPKD